MHNNNNNNRVSSRVHLVQIQNW